MLEESVRLIRETEARMEEEKAAARVRAQKLAIEAKRDAESLLADAEETLRQERKALLTEAERRAGERRQTILTEADAQCGALQTQAAQRQAEAVEMILARGV